MNYSNGSKQKYEQKANGTGGALIYFGHRIGYGIRVRGRQDGFTLIGVYDCDCGSWKHFKSGPGAVYYPVWSESA